MSEKVNLNNNAVIIGYKLSGDDTSQFKDVSLPNIMTFTVRNDTNIYDGLERFNAGYILKPSRYVFSINIPRSSPSYAEFMELALGRAVFDLKVNMEIRTGDSSAVPDKGKVRELMYCTIVSVNENIRVGELVVGTFEGYILRIKSAKDGESTEATEMFGDGSYPDGYLDNIFTKW